MLFEQGGPVERAETRKCGKLVAALRTAFRHSLNFGCRFQCVNAIFIRLLSWRFWLRCPLVLELIQVRTSTKEKALALHHRRFLDYPRKNRRKLSLVENYATLSNGLSTRSFRFPGVTARQGFLAEWLQSAPILAIPENRWVPRPDRACWYVSSNR